MVNNIINLKKNDGFKETEYYSSKYKKLINKNKILI